MQHVGFQKDGDEEEGGGGLQLLFGLVSMSPECDLELEMKYVR